MKVFLCFLLLCSIGIAQDKQTTPLVLVGGGSIPKDAVEWIKNKCTIKKFLVITCNPEASIKKWSPHFDLEVCLPENTSKVDLSLIGGIIIEGGDQWNYITRLDKMFIENAYKSGKPIIATSAGAQILGQFCFTAQEGSISSEEALADSPKIHLLNFLNIESLVDTFVDTHFTERDRFDRLKVFMRKSGVKRGYGIDEATALCIHEKLEVKGAGRVTVVNETSVEVLVPQEELIVKADEVSNISTQVK